MDVPALHHELRFLQSNSISIHKSASTLSLHQSMVCDLVRAEVDQGQFQLAVVRGLPWAICLWVCLVHTKTKATSTDVLSSVHDTNGSFASLDISVAQTPSPWGNVYLYQSCLRLEEIIAPWFHRNPVLRKLLLGVDKIASLGWRIWTTARPSLLATCPWQSCMPIPSCWKILLKI